MLLPDINFQTRETTLKSFEYIAEKFANSIQLRFNNALYRIVDFEFYAFTASDVMPDPHTYKNKLQLEKGKLFLHYSGVDITCGDGQNHCGILLRSVIKLNGDAGSGQELTKEQFTGPQVVSMELFSNLHNLESGLGNEISLLEVDNERGANSYPAKMIFTTKRIGLKAKKDDPENFYLNLKTRYIVVSPPSFGFRQKVPEMGNWLKVEVASGKITIKEAEELSREVLGYKVKF